MYKHRFYTWQWNHCCVWFMWLSFTELWLTRQWQTVTYFKVLSCVCAAGLSDMWAKYWSCWLRWQTNCLLFYFILFYFSSVNMETTYNCTETIVRTSILAPCPVRVWRQKNKNGWKKLGIFNMPQIGKGGLYFMVSSGLAQQPPWNFFS